MSDVVGIGGYNLKEWSLIIMWIALAFVFGVFGIAVAIAVANNPNIVIEGTIDVSQFTGIIIGIALVAVTLVAQKLTAQNQAHAVAATDKVWLESEKNEKSNT
jgi:hypothetical protein